MRQIRKVIELSDLKGRNKLQNYKLFSIVRFEGEYLHLSNEIKQAGFLKLKNT